MNIGTFLRAGGHYIEQPKVVHKAKWWAAGLGVAGLGGIGAMDVFNAKPEDRQKVLVRDAMVLGATAVGTAAASRFMIPSLKELKGDAENIIPEAVKFLKANYPENLAQPMINIMSKEKKSFGDFYNFFKQMKAKFPHSRSDHKSLGEEVEALMSGKPEEGFAEEAAKAVKFFTVGGISVISGLLGGLAANKINQVKDPDATVNMMKEGIFQFVANIALCAVGAMAALAFVNGEWVPVKALQRGPLKKLNDTGAQFAKKYLKNTAVRTGIIGMGLSVGIFGGSRLANFLGQRYVNPFFDRMQGKVPDVQTPSGKPKPADKRGIEIWDWILHLDDVPTAMALAGVGIIEPFIPLFFAFSGYRTGIGYRNGEGAKANAAEKTRQNGAAFSSPSQRPVMSPAYNPAVYGGGYNNRSPWPGSPAQSFPTPTSLFQQPQAFGQVTQSEPWA